MERTTRIASSIVIMQYPRKTRSDLATAMNIRPIIQGGEVCMGTATTLALLTTIWGLHTGIGEDCEPASASRRKRPTTQYLATTAGGWKAIFTPISPP